MTSATICGVPGPTVHALDDARADERSDLLLQRRVLLGRQVSPRAVDLRRVGAGLQLQLVLDAAYGLVGRVRWRRGADLCCRVVARVTARRR
jgi:hypothetical protein